MEPAVPCVLDVADNRASWQLSPSDEPQLDDPLVRIGIGLGGTYCIGGT